MERVEGLASDADAGGGGAIETFDDHKLDLGRNCDQSVLRRIVDSRDFLCTVSLITLQVTARSDIPAASLASPSNSPRSCLFGIASIFGVLSSSKPFDANFEDDAMLLCVSIVLVSTTSISVVDDNVNDFSMIFHVQDSGLFTCHVERFQGTGRCEQGGPIV